MTEQQFQDILAVALPKVSRQWHSAKFRHFGADDAAQSAAIVLLGRFRAGQLDGMTEAEVTTLFHELAHRQNRLQVRAASTAKRGGLAKGYTSTEGLGDVNHDLALIELHDAIDAAYGADRWVAETVIAGQTYQDVRAERVIGPHKLRQLKANGAAALAEILG